jgi:predicted 2-oxoglutarate/Fe(II)-dependent dioxygenase YbiX/peroxiredoxin
MPREVDLQPGDPAPWFHQRSLGNPRYAFDLAAGHYVVLCFFGSAGNAAGAAAIAAARARPELFDDRQACFFGVSTDPQDEATGRIAEHYPGYRFFCDHDGSVSRLFGAVPAAPGAPARPRWVVLDPMLRVLRVVPFRPEGGEAAAVLGFLESLPPAERFTGVEIQAPVILLPRVFEPELCRLLVERYEREDSHESGFMREVDGRTVGLFDPRHKRRRDHVIEDKALVGRLQDRFLRRVVPEILKAYQFRATRMERHIVACYAAEDGGHFRAHRDNTTAGTAHRRFAVSINLNEDFEGGEVSFPEFGPRGFRPPVGGAVVFSCSLLHAVSKVTRGRRYAYLPFLYDDAAARLRAENRRFLEGADGTEPVAQPPASEGGESGGGGEGGESGGSGEGGQGGGGGEGAGG